MTAHEIATEILRLWDNGQQWHVRPEEKALLAREYLRLEEELRVLKERAAS